MGCADSRKMLTNETKKDDKYTQKNLSKNNEINSKNTNNDNNLIKNNINSEENKINNEAKNKINDNDSDDFIIKCGTKNIITLIYYAKTKGVYKIFGENFVAYNKDNIHLVKNYKDSPFVHECELQEGDNRISLLIKKPLTYLTKMFSGCNSLKDISDIKYLDVSKVKYFDFTFAHVLTLSDISPLSNWDVSNGESFTSMFEGCSSLTNIKPLKYWNVSKGLDFDSMFNGCSKLNEIRAYINGMFLVVKILDVCSIIVLF